MTLFFRLTSRQKYLLAVRREGELLNAIRKQEEEIRVEKMRMNKLAGKHCDEVPVKRVKMRREDGIAKSGRPRGRRPQIRQSSGTFFHSFSTVQWGWLWLGIKVVFFAKNCHWLIDRKFWLFRLVRIPWGYLFVLRIVSKYLQAEIVSRGKKSTCNPSKFPCLSSFVVIDVDFLCSEKTAALVRVVGHDGVIDGHEQDTVCQRWICGQWSRKGCFET